MKNDSFLYFDTINKVFTSKNKLCRTLKIQPSFHAKPGFDDISMLQKYKKATDFRLISWLFGTTFGQASNPYHSRLVPRIGTFEWLWPMDYVSTCCLDCTGSREKNAGICCGMRNSSIVNRRAPLLSRALRMSLATSSGSCLVPVQVTNICKHYEHWFDSSLSFQ